MAQQSRLMVLLVFLCLLGVPYVSDAVTYHVKTPANGGNDSNTCTQAQNPSTPRATITFGTSCMTAAGDILNVWAGTYNDPVFISGHSNDGASGNPKIIQANPGDTVIWTSTAGTECTYSPALTMFDVSYWRIQGFTVSGVDSLIAFRFLNTFETVASRPTATSNFMVGIEILNNTFTNNGTDGGVGQCISAPVWLGYLGMGAGYTGSPVNIIQGNTFTSSFGQMIGLFATSDTLVENNTCTGMKGSRNGSAGGQYQTNCVSSGLRGSWRNIVRTNTISNIIQTPVTLDQYEGVGIRIDQDGENSVAQANIFEDNVIFDIGSEVPVWDGTRQFYGIFIENNSNNYVIRRNRIYRVGTSCIRIGSGGTPIVTGTIIYNNTFHDCMFAGIWLEHASNTTIKNNISSGPAGTDKAQINFSQHAVLAGGHVLSNNDWYQAGGNIGCWNWDFNLGPCTANRSFAQWVSDSGETNSISADPRWASSSTGDFRLCTGSGAPVGGCTQASPAINAGVDVGLSGGDTAPDLGALQTGGTVAPAAPTNLRIVSP